MAIVFKKILKVFKSKFVLVPVVIVGLAAIGAGFGYLTTNKATAGSEAVTITKDQSGYNRLLQNTLGDSTTTDGTTNSPSPTPTSKPGSSAKPKSTAASSSTTSSGTTQTSAVCDQSQKDAYSSVYNSAVDAENQRHLNWLNNNPDDGSQAYSDALNAENNQHTDTLGGLATSYANNLSSINC